MNSLTESPIETKIYSQIAAAFSNKHRQACNFIVRVPGRVNLIGEHIDYW